MNDFNSRWQRLVAAARRAPVTDEMAAPYGFATRVAARAVNEPRPGVAAIFARFSMRALYLACLLTLTGVATNYLAFAGTEDNEQNLIDPVSEVFTNAS